MGKKQKPKTYRLDVSSQFYPIIATSKSQSLFGLTAEMDAPVCRETLSRAVQRVLLRFPAFKVRLKRGYAWYKFEENDAAYEAGGLPVRPLLPIGREECGGYLFRLGCGGNRISLEMFHAVTDGMGALEFFKAIIFEYARLSGREISGREGVIDLDAEPTEEESEDAFYRYHRRVRLGDVELGKLLGERPMLIEGTPRETGGAVTFRAYDTESVRVAAKKAGASVTAFLAGTAACALRSLAPESERAVIIMVPVNLRAMFETTTLRNFVNFARLVFRPGEAETHLDFVRSAAEQLRERASKEEMSRFMSTTVSTERSLPLAVAPLWLKILAARIVRPLVKSRQTLIVSNLGRVTMPEGTGLRRLVFNLNVSRTSCVNAGALSLGGETTLAFSRSIEEDSLEQAMSSLLESAGARPIDGGVIAAEENENQTLSAEKQRINEAL